MKYRKLGRFGIRVSEVSLGGWLTHGRSLDDGATERIVHRAFDLGVNLFDTADAYHGGEAEKALAKATSGFKREELVLATKCYFPITKAPNDRGLSRKHIFESVHNSLKRLRTDYLDIMQFHRFDNDTPLDETVRAIDDLVRQGKVLYWGVSEWKAHQISEVVAMSRELNAHPPASNQPRYSMFARGIEADVLPVCEWNGLGVLAFSPLAQGVLTGKYKPGQPPPPGTRAAGDDVFDSLKDLMIDETLGKVERLKSFAEKHETTLATFALAWCLRRQELSSVIIGATSVEQLEGNIAASGLTFSDKIWAAAESILDGG